MFQTLLNKECLVQVICPAKETHQTCFMEQIVDGKTLNKDNYFGKGSVGVRFYAAHSVLFILSQYLPVFS